MSIWRTCNTELLNALSGIGLDDWRRRQRGTCSLIPVQEALEHALKRCVRLRPRLATGPPALAAAPRGRCPRATSARGPPPLPPPPLLPPEPPRLPRCPLLPPPPP